jgi:hypothetical protein
MPSSGWQVSFAAWLQHVGAVTGRALSWLPGWAVLLVLVGLAAALVAQAWWSRRRAAATAAETDAAGAPSPPVPGVSEITTVSARAGQEAGTHER